MVAVVATIRQPNQSRKVEHCASQIFGNAFNSFSAALPSACSRIVKTVLYVIVNQYLLCIRHGAFNRMKLLRQFEAASSVFEHSNDCLQMAFGAP